jgi:hypothetical protein
MIKITKNLLETLGWKRVESNGVYLNVYKSPNKRYEISYKEYAQLCDETGFGWILQIDNSRHESLGVCCVEYIEQIEALMEIYKDY